MPCFNATGVPIFHLHMPKMAGQALLQLVPKLLQQPLCAWAPNRFCAKSGHCTPDWGNPDHFAAKVRSHHEELASRPCFTSYEGSWDAIIPSFERVHTPPCVITMLREPHDWLLSAIEHDADWRRHTGIDDLFHRGCFKAFTQCDSQGYIYTEPATFLTREGDWKSPSRERFAVARARLDATVFGLVEEMQASMCLWQWQFGLRLNRSTCDCRHRRVNAVDKVGEHSESSTAKLLNASAGARSTLERMEFGFYDELYVYGVSLFVQRVRVVETSTGMKLLCRGDQPVHDRAFWIESAAGRPP